AAVGVRQSDLDLVAIDRAQGIEQVIHVEADLDFLALVLHLDLILGFLLLRIMRLEREQAGARGEPNAPVLLIGEDRRTLQRLAQRFTVGFDDAGRISWDNASVLRETTIDQLRSEANIADLGPNVIRANRHLDRSLGAQNSLQFQYTLAGHDHLVGRFGLAGELHLAERQSVSIGRHGTQRLPVRLEQQTTQLVQG